MVLRELILGGVRSGKSRTAERIARESRLPVTCVVTARIEDDEEMAARVAGHRRRRPAAWRTVEAPRNLGGVVREHAANDRFLLVDCLTLWLGNELLEGGFEPAERACDDLVDAVASMHGRCVMVSNEVGLGVIPMGEASRDFCDLAGHLHQRLATQCERVTWVAAGLSLPLKPHSAGR